MITNQELFDKYMQVSGKIRRFSKENGMVSPGGERPHGPAEGRMCPPPMPGMPPMMEGMHRHGPHPRRLSRERLLVLIYKYPEGIRQKDLAEAGGINASSTSEVVNRLEEDGYLVRTIDETDRRATLLKLTDLGKARAAELQDEKEAMLEQLFSALSKEEKETLATLLDKLIA